jgi:spore maturation protein CgeB
MNCGAMLLEQDSLELEKLYEKGKDYDEWRSRFDLLQKVKYYLSNEEERKSIAESGRNKTYEKYSAKAFWEEALRR